MISSSMNETGPSVHKSIKQFPYTILLLLLLVGCADICHAHPVQEDFPEMSRRPNIVLINLDDCDVDLVNKEQLKDFPSLARLANTSVRFTNCHVTTPLCGPSRACLFRSQYAHNTGYRTNRPNLDAGSGFTGGTQFFQDTGLSKDQLPVWMKDAGYHTMLVGKYFQGKTDHVPVPGWDRFVCFGGNSYLKVTRFNFYPEGKIDIGPRTGYRTELETDDVVELLDEYSKDVDPQKPFFLYVAPVAPHVGKLDENPVPEKWKDRFADARLPRSANFNEDDVSDKPVAYRDTLKLSPSEIDDLLVAQRRRLIAMLGVDEMVMRIRQKIVDMGQQENTVVIFTSDHGYLMGQHRMHGKSFPLVEATRVPLWVHWPGVVESREAGQLLAHIDISATVADLGGAMLPDFVDGRSFVKLLRDDSIDDPNAIRQAVLVENWESRLNSVSKRKVVYSSMVKANSIYTQWANGEQEFYDLESDPGQLNNTYGSLDQQQKNALRAELHSIRTTQSANKGATATLSFPTVNQTFVGPEIELQGYAEALSEASPVSVSIRRKKTGEYWNGLAWQKQMASIPAEIPVGAGLLYQWQVEPRVSELETGETLTIEVHTEEQGSRDDSIRRLDVVYDDQPPEVRITRPLDGFAYPEFKNFGGVISDDRGSEEVRLTVRDLQSEKFFDGDRWTTEETYMSVLLNPRNGRWHADHALPEGRFEVTAIGKDSAGNWSKPGSPVRVVIDRDRSTRQKLDEEIR